MLHEQKEVSGWVVMPDEVETRINEWRSSYADIVTVETRRQYAGLNVHAITVTDHSTDVAGKNKMLVHVPHAHEPGATAGCMDFLAALITGTHLTGQPFELERERILAEALITIIPTANSEGRSRAPVRYWDGSFCANEDFHCFMCGRDRVTGKMWKRLDLWDTRVETDHPDPIGIVYEQISEHEYVEPNRSRRSSLFNLFKQHMDMHPYDQMVAVHQTEFENSPYNAMVLLPCVQDDLPSAQQEKNMRLAQRIVSAWEKADAQPEPAPKALNCGAEQKAYFVKTWGDIYPRMTVATTEVQNNNPRTPPEKQLLFCEAGIRAAVEYLLDGCSKRRRD